MVQYTGTDLMLRDEGSDLQKKRLVSNGPAVLSDVDGTPLEDNYDAIPEITPSPPRAQFADDSVWSCCRFSRIPRQKLLLLDYWVMEGARRARRAGEEPDPYEMQYNQFKHDWQKFLGDEGYQPSLFYRLVTRSRRLGYLMLSLIREEKNIIDNEKFTRHILNRPEYITGDTLVQSADKALIDDPSSSSNGINDTANREINERAAFQKSVGTPAISLKESSPITTQGNSFESARSALKVEAKYSGTRPRSVTLAAETIGDSAASSISIVVAHDAQNGAALNPSARPTAAPHATDEIPMLQLDQRDKLGTSVVQDSKADVPDPNTQPTTHHRRSSTFLSPNTEHGGRGMPKVPAKASPPGIILHEATQPTDMEDTIFGAQRRAPALSGQLEQQYTTSLRETMPPLVRPPVSSTTTRSHTMMIGDHPLNLDGTPFLQNSRSIRRTKFTDNDPSSGTSNTRKRSVVIEENLSILNNVAQQSLETKLSATNGTARRDSFSPNGAPTHIRPHVLAGSSPILPPTTWINSEEIPTNGDVSDAHMCNGVLHRPTFQDPLRQNRINGCHSVFVIIGWFPSDLSEPVETCVIVEDLGHFLPDLKWHITGLRGWRALLSFKSVQGFGLYRCRPQQLGHVSHHTTEMDNLALAQFFDATSRSYRRANMPKQEGMDPLDPIFLKRKDSQAWAEWVHINLNNKRSCPFRSQLSLKLVLRWSQGRIATASLCPLLLSFAVGAWYAKVYNDVQTGFTVASYIVTAGAFIIAILAILTALKDGPATPYPKVRISDDVV